MSIGRNPAVGRHFGFDFLDGGFSFGATGTTPALAFAGAFVASPLRRRIVRGSRTGASVLVRVLRMRGCKYMIESRR